MTRDDDLRAAMRARMAPKAETLFEDREEATRRRDEAIAAAERGASDAWIAAAQRALADVVRLGRPFTADDVWRRLRVIEPDAATPPEPRAMGGILRAARYAGSIIATPDFRVSDRPSNHRRPERLWRPAG